MTDTQQDRILSKCPACGGVYRHRRTCPDWYPARHVPGCTTAPHDGECTPELDRLSDPHDCEPTDDGTACRVCGLPAERDDITPAELVALVAALAPEGCPRHRHTYSWCKGCQRVAAAE